MFQQRLTLAAALVCAVALGACSGDSTGSNGPASVAVSGGGNQPGVTWHDLRSPLEVTVSNKDGGGVSGVGVKWTVTGDADLDSVTTHTNAAGRATNRLSIGEATGTVTVTASVGKLPAAHFTIVVTKPCDARIPLPYGASVSEEIEPLDCQLADGSFVDLYTATIPAQRVMRITETSSQVQPFVVAYGATGEVLAYEEAGTGGTSAAFNLLAPAGTYLLGAGSHDVLDLGTYTLSAVDEPGDASPCLLTWVARGIAATRSVSASCGTSTAHYSEYAMVLKDGQTVTIGAESAVLDPRVEVYESTTGGAIRVALDDNSGGGTSARLVFTPRGTSVYYIFVYAKAGGVGAFTLTVQ
jgi:hypothetical protein